MQTISHIADKLERLLLSEGTLSPDKASFAKALIEELRGLDYYPQNH